MKVGDLVQYDQLRFGDDPNMRLIGVLVKDHSPMRPLTCARVMDVFWGNGEVEEAHTDDLEIVSESR